MRTITALRILSLAAAWLGWTLDAASAVRAGTGSPFAAGPKAAATGEAVTITFTLAEPTDVEVAVLDARGRVVRHLGAARLGGESAPPAPFRKGLAQSLAWDRLDDSCRPARGGPFEVRLRTGLSATFERIIGWSGQSLAWPKGLACGPCGTLYVIDADHLYAHRQTWLVLAFDRQGKYLRQAFPGPAGLPPEKRPGWPRVALDGGHEVPVVFQALSRCTYPGSVMANRMFPVVTGDGRLILLSGPGATTIKHDDFRGGRRLLILGTDGSVPGNWLGPEVCAQVGGAGHLALSPDERFVYVTGLVDTGRKGKGPVNVVYRVPLDGAGASEIFLGRPYETLEGEAGLDDPQGIDVDARGNLYVADYAHDRIAVFRPDGSYLDEIPIACPDTVRVSRKTGAVYVVQLEKRTKAHTHQHYYVPAHNWKLRRVVKLGGLEDKTEKAFLESPARARSRLGGGSFLSLDESGEEPILWVSGLAFGSPDVLRTVDRGDRLESLGDPIAERIEKGQTPLPFVGDVAVVEGKVVTGYPTFRRRTSPESLVFDAATGAPLEPFVPKTADRSRRENYWNLVYGEMTSGKDGRIYFHADENVLRYDPSGDPAPFESTGSHILGGLPFDRHTHISSMFINRAGDIYVAVREEGKGQARDEDVMCIRVIGADGKVKHDALIQAQGTRLGGLAVDPQGNVLLGAQVSRPEERVPPWFEGKLPPDGPAHHPSIDYAQYGSVIKFPPSGGRIVLDRNGPLVAHRQKVSAVRIEDGRLIARAGLVPGKYDKTGLGCACEVTRLDVDDFGRLYVPDVFRFCVLVLDGEGNEITRFGGFGNMDSRGPSSPVSQPQVPLGWPLAVRLLGERAVVADLVNRRIVAVKMACAKEAVCPVP